MNILITGVAGFIGMHTAKSFLSKGNHIIGVDNLDNYYDTNLKKNRLKKLKHKNFIFEKINIINKSNLQYIFEKYDFDYVIHLAAQAGVRYSLINPQAYIDSNIQGFFNILENCKLKSIKHLLFASSSSVYGMNTILPYSETHISDHPISLYGATKKSNEMFAHSYSHLYNIPMTGMRFFTVYGPWGRPDMAPMIFIKSIIKSEPINIHNNGDMMRDFTYIDDVVWAIDKLISKIPKPKKISPDQKIYSDTSSAPYKILNIGNSKPTKLLEFVETLEKILKIKSNKKMLPNQKGDVRQTFSDNESTYNWINFLPKVPLNDGVEKFVNWYKQYYRISV